MPGNAAPDIARIKKATNKAGDGMVARVNAGNTPLRVMPMLWAYGSGALDEAEPEPTYQKVLINNEGGSAALQALYDMYVREKLMPTSALTNTQTENGDLYIAGQIAMEISQPSEYAATLDKANKATGADKDQADEVVANMAYGLMPAGPVRRAVVFRWLESAHLQRPVHRAYRRSPSGHCVYRVYDRSGVIGQELW